MVIISSVGKEREHARRKGPAHLEKWAPSTHWRRNLALISSVIHAARGRGRAGAAPGLLGPDVLLKVNQMDSRDGKVARPVDVPVWLCAQCIRGVSLDLGVGRSSHRAHIDPAACACACAPSRVLTSR